jgi:hypothetical protein
MTKQFDDEIDERELDFVYGGTSAVVASAAKQVGTASVLANPMKLQTVEIDPLRITA